MMSYDGLLAHLTEDKLELYPRQQAQEAGAQDHRDGVPVEEEQAAVIQNMPARPRRSHNASTPPPISQSSQSHSRDVTPQRKISTSTRFMNAFQQLYTGATGSGGATTTNNIASSTTTTLETDDIDGSSNNGPGLGRTPTKGMESKLLSMWHNVKYGWSGKLKSNFSKEQPVWLLGRCYHRKYTPPASMENSTELSGGALGAMASTPTIENAQNAELQETTATTMQSPATAPANLYPPLPPQQVEEIVVPQELGLDASQNAADTTCCWEEGIEGFRRDFYSRIWMTYRREFPLMNGTNYTSDCGWGCMLRTGQMLLAQGLICHFLGRSWRYDPETQLHSTYEDNMHRKIIKWFGDCSSKGSPFSIHALVSLGEELGKKPGDWYGPASVSFLLKQALKKASQEIADFDNITIYVAKDCTVYIQDIEDECSIPEPPPKPQVPWQTARSRGDSSQSPSPAKTDKWKSLIILIPLRLGTEKLNPVYAHCLKLLLSTEYCIGIIGGRPKHSLYFVGFQEDRLIHLDPHYCQEMVDVRQEQFPLHSFHCKSPRKLKTAKMDPSCCIGFYCATKSDFNNFMESVQLYLHPMRCASGTIDKVLPASQQMPQTTNASANLFNACSDSQPPSLAAAAAEMTYPLFSFSRGRCQDHEERNEMSDSFYKPVQQQLLDLRQDLEGHTSPGGGANAMGVSNPYDDDDETEEFVLL